MYSFVKMHGLGNHFVIFDTRRNDLNFSNHQIERISDTNFGIGCDQFIIIKKPISKDADIFMQIYNHDGGESSACGNATRCVASLLFEESQNEYVTIETKVGLLKCRKDGSNSIIEVNMGNVSFAWNKIPLAKAEFTSQNPLKNLTTKSTDKFTQELSKLTPYFANTGNPHCIYVLDEIEDKAYLNSLDFDKIDISKVAKIVQNSEFFPEGVNVEFVKINSEKLVSIRIYERGVGETLSCGTGACAVASTLIENDIIKTCQINIKTPGSTKFGRMDYLTITYNKLSKNVKMSGKVERLFSGILSEEILL